MAVQTIILRPTYSTKALASSATVNTVPANTPFEDLYLLVSEEVPDDASTYFQVDTAISTVGLSFTVPELYKTLCPSAIRIIVRAAGSTSNAGLQLNCREYINDDGKGDIFDSSVIGGSISTSENYDTYILNANTEYVSDVWSVLKDANVYSYGFLLFSMSGAKKSTNVTQVYIEADFEVEEPSGVYVKKNGVFTEALQMYHKVDDVWTEITADECKTLIQTYNTSGGLNVNII